MMVKINVEDYEESGLGDLYYGLISFISHYVSQNFNPMDFFVVSSKEQSEYAFAIDNMKKSLKELLDYLKSNNQVYLKSLKKMVFMDKINFEEQLALEEICKEYMITKLNDELNNLEFDDVSVNKKNM